MMVVDGQGIPRGNHLDRASPAEVTWVERTLLQGCVPRAGRGRPKTQPARLIADRAYDSDPLRQRLHQRGIQLICPHRQNRRKAPTQDGRVLRRYRRRWQVERTVAWLGNLRRLVVRDDRSLLMSIETRING